MLRKRRRYLTCCMVILGFVVLLAGCSREGIQALRDLTSLQEKLVAEYGASHVKIEIQDESTLGVTIVNSSFNGLARDQKEEEAREIASFVCENYASMGRAVLPLPDIDKVWVAFEIHQDGSIVDTTGSVTFVFEKSELECGDS